MDNFLYLKELNRKTYITSKKSIIISGPPGVGKTSYLTWHAFQSQNKRAEIAAHSLKEQIKQEGYVSFYVDMTKFKEDEVELSPFEQHIQKTKFFRLQSIAA